MWFDLALIAAGGFLAALVVGSAGFAFAIIVTGVWIYVLPPAQIVLLAAVCATLLHIASIWRFRREIEFRLLWPFVLGGVLGVPLGVLALQRLDAALFRHVFGAFMIAYSCYMLWRPHFPVARLSSNQARIADGMVGWVSGILGGFALLHGTLPTIWCSLRGWDKLRLSALHPDHRHRCHAVRGPEHRYRQDAVDAAAGGGIAGDGAGPVGGHARFQRDQRRAFPAPRAMVDTGIGNFAAVLTV